MPEEKLETAGGMQAYQDFQKTEICARLNQEREDSIGTLLKLKEAFPTSVSLRQELPKIINDYAERESKAFLIYHAGYCDGAVMAMQESQKQLSALRNSLEGLLRDQLKALAKS